MFKFLKNPWKRAHNAECALEAARQAYRAHAAARERKHADEVRELQRELDVARRTLGEANEVVARLRAQVQQMSER